MASALLRASTSPTSPYSSRLYRVKFETGAHVPGRNGWPSRPGEQVSQMPRGEHTPLAATYGWHVSSGTPSVLMYSYTPVGSPPLQLPPPRQLMTTCGDSTTSDHAPARATFSRSLSAVSVANAQHDPQYWGKCCCRVGVK